MEAWLRAQIVSQPRRAGRLLLTIVPVAKVPLVAQVDVDGDEVAQLEDARLLQLACLGRD